jgi:hypothetical protein
MSAPHTVSQAYLVGISEGRSLWRQFEREGEANLATAKACLATVETLLGESFAGDMREAFKGERDFWRQRVKLLAEARARPIPA